MSHKLDLMRWAQDLQSSLIHGEEANSKLISNARMGINGKHKVTRLSMAEEDALIVLVKIDLKSIEKLRCAQKSDARNQSP